LVEGAELSSATGVRAGEASEEAAPSSARNEITPHPAPRSRASKAMMFRAIFKGKEKEAGSNPFFEFHAFRAHFISTFFQGE